MHIIFSKYTLLGCNRINKARLKSSKYVSSESSKKQQKIRHGKAKQKYEKNNKRKGKHKKMKHFSVRECLKTSNFLIHKKLFITIK